MNKTIVFSGIAVVTAATIVAGSVLFTNPAAAIGSISTGFNTESQILDKIQKTVSEAQVLVSKNDTETVSTTLGELGVSIENTQDVVSSAFSEQVFWKVGNWGTKNTANLAVGIDESKLDAFTESLQLPVSSPAKVEYVDSSWKVSNGVTGYVVDRESLRSAAKSVVNDGVSEVNVSVIPDTETVSESQAQTVADELNSYQESLTFQFGEEQVKPSLEAPVFAVTNENDVLVVAPDPDGVNALASLLPEMVEREGKARHTITDSAGEVLWVTEEGHSQRNLSMPMDEMKATITEAVSQREPVINIAVEEIAVPDVATSRRITVDLSDQKTYLYENEKIVKEYTISSGKRGTETDMGDFRVRAFVRMQDMGCVAGFSYCTENVPWVVYFNGDEAFHGAYWHNNFGTPMSHGCVNLRISEAEEVYRFAYIGMEVSVQE